MKIAKILTLPNVRILTFILESGGEVRYSDLSRLIRSRGALSNAYRELDEEKLIQRRIEQKARPVQAFYSLTKKGRELAAELVKISDAMES